MQGRLLFLLTLLTGPLGTEIDNLANHIKTLQQSPDTGGTGGNVT